MEIGFKIKNQTLKKIGKNNKPANKSQEFLEFSFDFTTLDWDDLSKFALFGCRGKNYRVALVNDKCIVPNAVLLEDKFVFSVYGVDNENVRATTNQLTVYLSDSGYTTDVENDIDDTDPTIVEQIYIDIAKAEIDAKGYADNGLALKVDKTMYDAKVEELENGKSDVGHTHTESDITDLKEYSVVGHKHNKSDVTDFAHTHTESEITDLKSYVQNNQIVDNLTTDDASKVLSAKQGKQLKTLVDGKADSSHTHTKSQITDFSHNHDDRYYTEDEVNAIINSIQNNIAVNGDKNIIQTGDTIDLRAFVMEDGMPQQGKVVNFYIDEEEEEE